MGREGLSQDRRGRLAFLNSTNVNPFGALTRKLLQERGYRYRKNFSKFLPESSLLLYLTFRPVENAFDSTERNGFAISFQVFYPGQDAFFLISPDELRDLRRDGSLLHVCYTNEIDGIFDRAEKDTVATLLNDWLDFWEVKIGVPDNAIEIAGAFRQRTPFPAYLSYLQNFIPWDEHEKLNFELERRSLVWPFDGGVNLLSNVAHLNAGQRFEQAQRLAIDALDGRYLENVRHVRVVMDDRLKKLLEDAETKSVRLSKANVSALRKLGHLQ